MTLNIKFKKFIRKLTRGEQGQVIPLVLIMLVLGSTILVGTLAYASTTLDTTKLTEDRADQLYAADAGVRWAIWKLTYEGLPATARIPGWSEIYFPPDVNGKTMTVNIDCIGSLSFYMAYRITSTASDQNADGSATTIEVYTLKRLGLWDFAVTSTESITVKPSCGSYANSEVIIKGPTVPTVCEESEAYPADEYPFDDESLAFFKEYFTNGLGSPIEEDKWDVSLNSFKDGWYVKPPLNDDGIYKLDILNTVPNADPENPITASLGSAEPPPTGSDWATIYVENDSEPENAMVWIGQTGNDFILDLNRNTIFVEGDIRIGGKCTITGSGCIIATGDVTFMPKMDSDPDDFVFIMSLRGTVTFQPSGDFYGSIAAYDNVQLQPGNLVELTEPPSEGINFPLDNDALPLVWSIRTWNVDRAADLGLRVATTSLVDGQVGQLYSQTLSAANGTGPYTWAVTNGNLPGGLTLDGTGTIIGEPDVVADDTRFTFTVTVTDSIGATASKELGVMIHPELSIVTLILPDGTFDIPYNTEIVATGGVTPLTWSITPDTLPFFPSWATLGYDESTHTAVIYGTPDVAGISYGFSVRVDDILGAYDIQPMTIYIVP